jgi:hypothetical protein
MTIKRKPTPDAARSSMKEKIVRRLTRGEMDVLRLVGGVVRGALPKSHFDSFPHRRVIAKNLMWAGLLEASGDLRDGVQLTPAGRYLLKS